MCLTRCVAKRYLKYRLSEITFGLPCKQCRSRSASLLIRIYTVSETLADLDLHCLSSSLCIIIPMLFLKKRRGYCNRRLSSGPYFLICSYFYLLFLKNALLSLLLHSKVLFTCKYREIFLACSAGLYLIIYLMYLFGERPEKHLKILFLTQNGSLFSLYYFNSYYPAYLV